MDGHLMAANYVSSRQNAAKLRKAKKISKLCQVQRNVGILEVTWPHFSSSFEENK
jgi:hypothetical protein